MENSQYAIVNRDDLAQTYAVLHGIFEEVAEALFKDMDENVRYSFYGQDKRKYTLTVKGRNNVTKDIPGTSE